MIYKTEEALKNRGGQADKSIQRTNGKKKKLKKSQVISLYPKFKKEVKLTTKHSKRQVTGKNVSKDLARN